jgi:hypothetical protein
MVEVRDTCAYIQWGLGRSTNTQDTHTKLGSNTHVSHDNERQHTQMMIECQWKMENMGDVV